MNRARVECRIGLLMLLALVGACASGGSGSGGGGASGGGPNLITREQIDALPEGNAYTIIERYRSAWLRARTPATLSNPEPATAIVFLDDMRHGELESLYRINSMFIQSIQYLSATDATTLYGTGYMGGVIRVNTRR